MIRAVSVKSVRQPQQNVLLSLIIENKKRLWGEDLMLDIRRHQGIVSAKKLDGARVTLIGAGSVGSFAALLITKLGLQNVEVYDEDYVETWNMANQFYRVTEDYNHFKVDALAAVIEQFSGIRMIIHKEKYAAQKLAPIVIVATDTMDSRKLVWEQAKLQGVERFIEARMGGQSGSVYSIDALNLKDRVFWEEMWYPDSEVEAPKCTERTIVDNVAQCAVFISRAFRAHLNKEEYPREVVFDLRNMIFMKRA